MNEHLRVGILRNPLHFSGVLFHVPTARGVSASFRLWRQRLSCVLRIHTDDRWHSAHRSTRDRSTERRRPSRECSISSYFPRVSGSFASRTRCVALFALRLFRSLRYRGSDSSVRGTIRLSARPDGSLHVPRYFGAHEHRCEHLLPTSPTLSLTRPMSQFNHVEAAWYDSASAAIVDHAASLPSERFYAGSFWLLYVDYTMFGLPCFALSTESHILEHGQYLRWSPADWQFSCIETAMQDMQSHYSAITEELSGRCDADWERAIDAHHACLARVCRRLTHDARTPFRRILRCIPAR